MYSVKLNCLKLLTNCFQSMSASFLVTMKLTHLYPRFFSRWAIWQQLPSVYWPCLLVSKLKPLVIRNARMENHNGMLRLPRTCNVIWPAELVTNECHFRQRSLYPHLAFLFIHSNRMTLQICRGTVYHLCWKLQWKMLIRSQRSCSVCGKEIKTLKLS